MEKRVITIHDVAADANVSIATVSRVLNEPWRVLPDTKQRVTDSVDKLGYVPNMRARLLARGDSGTICFLLSNRPFAHSVHAQVLQGASVKADILGVQVVYAVCSYEPETPPALIEMPRMLAARGLIDGVVVAGTNYPNMLQAIEELGLPYVVYGTNMVSDGDGQLNNAVYIDDEQGGYLATTRLIELGHTRIRYIGDTAMPWYRRRYEGFARAMQEAGLPCPFALGSSTEGEMAMGFNTTNELIASGEEFTALFVGGDGGALGAMRALRKRGYRVPFNVSVIGFNDEELAEIAEPPLTTVHSPNEEAGMQCVEMLHSLVAGTREDGEPVMLPVKLVERESVSAPQSQQSTVRS